MLRVDVSEEGAGKDPGTGRGVAKSNRRLLRVGRVYVTLEFSKRSCAVLAHFPTNGIHLTCKIKLVPQYLGWGGGDIIIRMAVLLQQ
jgi:hypothetical protein